MVSKLITVDNITKKFGAKTAIKDISFQVEAGEVLAIVGHNGAGKTTLVNCLVDIYKPNQGNIDYLLIKRVCMIILEYRCSITILKIRQG